LGIFLPLFQKERREVEIMGCFAPGHKIIGFFRPFEKSSRLDDFAILLAGILKFLARLIQEIFGFFLGLQDFGS
jgi:hypothetical protein